MVRSDACLPHRPLSVSHLVAVLVWNHADDYVGIDLGCAHLIVDGKVAFKAGCELERFTPEGVVFGDKSALAVDVVIFAYVPFLLSSKSYPRSCLYLSSIVSFLLLLYE